MIRYEVRVNKTLLGLLVNPNDRTTFEMDTSYTFTDEQCEGCGSSVHEFGAIGGPPEKRFLICANCQTKYDLTRKEDV